MFLISGCAGFIQTDFVLNWFAMSDKSVVNLDLLAHTRHGENLVSLAEDREHIVTHCDIGDSALVIGLLNQYQPNSEVNFAVNIQWPIQREPILYAKDQQAKSLATAERFV